MASVVNSNNKRLKKSGSSTDSNNKKKENIAGGMKLRKKTSFRQMSLKESFSNQETISKRLRPRKASRNYCEDSVLQQSNKKMGNELIEDENSKVPVYKSVKLNEESLKNESDIYDFKFDADDSKERIVTKRRRHLINRIRQKKVKRATRANLKVVPPKVEEKASNDVPSVNIGKKAKNNRKPVPWSSTDIVKKSTNDIKKKDVLPPSTTTVKKLENDIKKEHIPLLLTDINSTENVPNDTHLSTDTNDIEVQSNNVQNVETNDPPVAPVAKITIENTKKQPNATAKPRIISIENFEKDKMLIDTPVKSNLEHHVPFRKTNIFKNKVSSQYGNMINHSLINKSLSPITKATEHFDPGSPWRLSPLNTFSQVRNLFQSTPQIGPIEILRGRIKRNTKNQVKNLLETVKKKEILESDNENTNMHKTLDKSNHITTKLGQSIRRFGTEITNLDHSAQSANATVIEQYEGTTSNRDLKLPDINMQNMNNSVPIVPPTYDSAEDKENAAPKSSKSKKRLKKRVKRINNASTPQKENSMQSMETQKVQLEPISAQISSPGLSHAQPEKEEQSKENFDPQPGPSGLQKNKSPSNKPLQQTNLNAFLNIGEMPQSTRISTAHGIFNDAHSTPIYGKPLKPLRPVDAEKIELENAFGFKEDSNESNLDISPIYFDLDNKDVENKKIEKITVPQTRKTSALPVRLLPRSILKDMVQKNVDISKDDAKNVGIENAETKKTSSDSTNEFTNTVNFSDTFDILGENNTMEEAPSAVPLFTDCEPIHFTQPPKRSYKRKRNVKFSFLESGSEDNEESDESESNQRKKKKYGTLKKLDVQRMKQWIKSINNTFQEIDKHELHVE